MSGFLDVNHSGETYRVMLKRAPAARRFTLRVRASSRDVLLTMPGRGALADARDFAQRHAAWIGARLRRLPAPVPFAPGEIIPFRGEPHLIAHRPGIRGTVWVEDIFPGPGENTPRLLCVAGSSEHVARRVSDFLKAAAKSDLDYSVRKYTLAIGKQPLRVTLRDTTSRWGSCSASGSLNFSWRLILAPPFVLDYLAAHEAGHLVHLNHSDRFWKLVNSLCAETGRAEAWLSAHGSSLHRFGKALSADM
jgi:predicted metal-dependent hydrolase